MGRGGKVKGDDVMPLGLVSAMGGEGDFVGDLKLGRVRTGLRRRVVVLRRVVTSLLQGGGHVGGDLDLAGWPDVLAGFGDGDGFLAEADDKVSGDAGFEWAYGENYLMGLPQARARRNVSKRRLILKMNVEGKRVCA